MNNDNDTDNDGRHSDCGNRGHGGFRPGAGRKRKKQQDQFKL